MKANEEGSSSHQNPAYSSDDDMPLEDLVMKYGPQYQPPTPLLVLVKAWTNHLLSVHGGSKSHKTVALLTHQIVNIAEKVGGKNCSLAKLLDHDVVYQKFFKFMMQQRDGDSSKGLSCNSLTSYSYALEQFLTFVASFIQANISTKRKAEIQSSIKVIDAWRGSWKKRKRQESDKREWVESNTLVTPSEIKAMVHSKHAEMLQASCDTCEINKPSFFTILEIRNWLMFSITVENFNRAGVCSNMTMQDLGLENIDVARKAQHAKDEVVGEKKSELADCLKTHTTPLTEMPGDIDVTIIDGAVVVNMVKPGIDERTFSEYATGSFIPYIKAQLRHVRRLDVIWDEYVENSLKATTRCKRGSGVRQRVEADNRLPRKWQDFLRVDENKRELFKFLAECVVASTDAQKQVISTYGEQVLCSIPRESISSLAPCKHEEADTRMLLHAADAVQSGHNKILLRTVDTDVLVLAVACVQKIQLRQDSDDACIELWVAFGAGTHLRYIAAHEISRSLNPEVSIALPVFHAFTGCDTVSCFAGRGKKTALATWDSYPDVTTAFIDLANSPSLSIMVTRTKGRKEGVTTEEVPSQDSLFIRNSGECPECHKEVAHLKAHLTSGVHDWSIQKYNNYKVTKFTLEKRPVKVCTKENCNWKDLQQPIDITIEYTYSTSKPDLQQPPAAKDERKNRKRVLESSSEEEGAEQDEGEEEQGEEIGNEEEDDADEESVDDQAEGTFISEEDQGDEEEMGDARGKYGSSCQARDVMQALLKGWNLHLASPDGGCKSDRNIKQMCQQVESIYIACGKPASMGQIFDKDLIYSRSSKITLTCMKGLVLGTVHMLGIQAQYSLGTNMTMTHEISVCMHNLSTVSEPGGARLVLQKPNIESNHVFLGQYGKPFEASYVHRALKSFASKTLILEHEVVQKFCATMLRKVSVTNTRDQSDTSKTNIATLMCHSLPTANRHYSLQNKLDQSSKGHDAMRALFGSPVKQATEVAADDIDSDVELGSTVASTNTVPPTPPRKKGEEKTDEIKETAEQKQETGQDGFCWFTTKGWVEAKTDDIKETKFPRFKLKNEPKKKKNIPQFKLRIKLKTPSYAPTIPQTDAATERYWRSMLNSEYQMALPDQTDRYTETEPLPLCTCSVDVDSIDENELESPFLVVGGGGVVVVGGGGGDEEVGDVVDEEVVGGGVVVVGGGGGGGGDEIIKEGVAVDGVVGGVDAVDAVEAVGGVDAADAVGAVYAVGAVDAVGAVGAVGAVDAVEAVGGVDAADAVGAVYAVGDVDAVGAVGAVGAADAVAAVYAVDAVVGVDAVGAVGAADAVGVVYAVDAVVGVDAVGALGAVDGVGAVAGGTTLSESSIEHIVNTVNIGAGELLLQQSQRYRRACSCSRASDVGEPAPPPIEVNIMEDIPSFEDVMEPPNVVLGMDDIIGMIRNQKPTVTKPSSHPKRRQTCNMPGCEATTVNLSKHLRQVHKMTYTQISAYKLTHRERKGRAQHKITSQELNKCLKMAIPFEVTQRQKCTYFTSTSVTDKRVRPSEPASSSTAMPSTATTATTSAATSAASASTTSIASVASTAATSAATTSIASASVASTASTASIASDESDLSGNDEPNVIPRSPRPKRARRSIIQREDQDGSDAEMAELDDYITDPGESDDETWEMPRPAAQQASQQDIRELPTMRPIYTIQEGSRLRFSMPDINDSNLGPFEESLASFYDYCQMPHGGQKNAEQAQAETAKIFALATTLHKDPAALLSLLEVWRDEMSLWLQFFKKALDDNIRQPTTLKGYSSTLEFYLHFLITREPPSENHETLAIWTPVEAKDSILLRNFLIFKLTLSHAGRAGMIANVMLEEFHRRLFNASNRIYEVSVIHHKTQQTGPQKIFLGEQDHMMMAAYIGCVRSTLAQASSSSTHLFITETGSRIKSNNVSKVLDSFLKTTGVHLDKPVHSTSIRKMWVSHMAVMEKDEGDCMDLAVLMKHSRTTASRWYDLTVKSRQAERAHGMLTTELFSATASLPQPSSTVSSASTPVAPDAETLAACRSILPSLPSTSAVVSPHRSASHQTYKWTRAETETLEKAFATLLKQYTLTKRDIITVFESNAEALKIWKMGSSEDWRGRCVQKIKNMAKLSRKHPIADQKGTLSQGKNDPLSQT
ncbi:hypothetical protein QZH41_002604 [Actinostola sp. cb2023]|nr:hypothetical protein QZH41_002604 [Actinostola sp. cb2023]